jgi:hypothetical protein
MKTMRLKLGVVLACMVGTAFVAASPASALVKANAEEVAYDYALVHYEFVYFPGCVPSGKNKKNEAQWYCAGKFQNRGGEYHINVGPYGEITYHQE